MLSWCRRRFFARPTSPAPRTRPGVESLEDRTVPVTNVTDLTGRLFVSDLTDRMVGKNVTVQSATYTGAPQAAGVFAGGRNSIAMNDGVVLSTGTARGTIGLGPAVVASTINNTPGDPRLDGEANAPTVDMAELDLLVVPRFSTLALTYVFASETYPVPVGAARDVLAIYVDDIRMNVVPATRQIVGTDTVNATLNKSLFVNNVTRPTSMNGFTVPITNFLTVTPNVAHHVRIEVVDGNVGATDSAVFIGAHTLESYPTPVMGPLRYTFNARTRTFDGSFTVTNLTITSLPGPVFLVITPPPGMTLAMPHGNLPNGQQFVVISNILGGGQTYRVFFKLSLSSPRSLGTAFVNAFHPQLQNFMF